MRKSYEPETNKQIVCLHLEQGRTIKSLSEEYRMSVASVSNWVSQFRKECQDNSQAKEFLRRRLISGLSIYTILYETFRTR